MNEQERRNRRRYDVAFGVVAFLGLFQGLVPLVVRLLFDLRRFAPALRLPTPWWWITCLMITAATVALLAVIAIARQRRFPTKSSEPMPPRPSTPEDSTPEDSTSTDDATRAYETASAVVFLIGLYNGVAPFIAKLIFDRDRLLLALPLRLPAPWWWVTSLAVVVVTIVLLASIDWAKQRRQQHDHE